MDTLSVSSHPELREDTTARRGMSSEELHAHLISELDLEKIDEEVESLGYLVLKRKDETVAIYSLRTHSLLRFPGSGDGKSFIKLSGAETDRGERVYMSVGGVEKDDDVIGIRAFFILENDTIEEVVLTEEHSFLTAIIKYGIRGKIGAIDEKWEKIQIMLDGANRFLDGVNEGHYHRANNTLQ